MNILIAMPAGEIRDLFLPAANAALLDSLGHVTWNPHERHLTDGELIELLPRMDAVVTGWGCAPIGAAVLGDKHPGILAHTGGTVAPFVDETTFAKGIHVVCANEIYAKSVAEGTIAYMLACLRRIPYWTHKMYREGWQEPGYKTYGLFGKYVGLTGYGAITRHLIPLLQAFEAEILLYSGHMSEADCAILGVRKATLDEIFATCDVVSIHNAMTEKTRGLVDERLLSMLRTNAVFINTARGAVVDEAALAKLLRAGRFTAMLDVYTSEPLAEDSPLRGLDNAYLMPHMAGPTTDLYAVSGAAVIEEIRRWRDGEPLQREVEPSSVGHMTQAK